MSRTIDALAADAPAALKAIDAARAKARARVWELAGVHAPDHQASAAAPLVIDIDATLVELWRGLLRRGLVAGRLVTEPAVRLQLDWAAAQWLLAPAAVTCAINRAYERVYPGAWEAIGIPGALASSIADCRSWLARS